MNFSGLKYYLTFTLWLDILPIKFLTLKMSQLAKKKDCPSQLLVRTKLTTEIELELFVC